MGTLIFICPGTRQTVSTGIEIDPASFSTLESDGLWEVHRPQCSETPPTLANFCYPKPRRNGAISYHCYRIGGIAL
jgi:hypothetical protein